MDLGIDSLSPHVDVSVRDVMSSQLFTVISILLILIILIQVLFGSFLAAIFYGILFWGWIELNIAQPSEELREQMKRRRKRNKKNKR